MDLRGAFIMCSLNTLRKGNLLMLIILLTIISSTCFLLFEKTLNADNFNYYHKQHVVFVMVIIQLVSSTRLIKSERHQPSFLSNHRFHVVHVAN